MNLYEYQDRIVEIWETNKTPEEELLFCCVGMAEEAGEAMGKIKRMMRGEGFDTQKYLLELGDVLAYWVVAQNACFQMNKNFTIDVIRRPLITPSSILRKTIDLYGDCFHLLDMIEDKQHNVIEPCLEDILTSIRGCIAVQPICKSLEEVMQLNLDKLADRKARNGTLRGSGDDR